MTTVTPPSPPPPAPPAAGPAPVAPAGSRLPGVALLRAQPTPRKLVVALIAIVVAAAILLAVTASSVSSASGAMQTIGHTDAPEITADEDISFALADMDAQAANWLLVGRRALGSTEADAGAAYYRDRDLATRDLIAASHTSGNGAQGSIGSVLTGLTTYHGYALQAELLADQGDARGALDEYRLATDLMHGTLLPAMASVTAINVKDLDDAYNAQQSASARGIALVVLVGLLLLAVLVATQWFLLQQMRRIVNPGLLAASLAALVFTVMALSTLGGVGSDLQGAKQDAFDSLLALSSGRATAYDANSNRSRALIDAFRAPQYQKAFEADTTQILGSAFGNAALPGAQDAVQAARTAFQKYQADDQRLVAMKGDEAIAYATSVSHGNSDYDFYVFDAALQKAIGIDQAYLTAYVSESDNRLSPWTWLPVVAAVLVVILSVAGLWPRLREYQGG